MQIIINISKEKYDEIMSMDWVNCRRFFDEEIRAIHDGKVLPAGHGRLIDADALIDSLDASDRDIYCKAVIEEDAPIIIEADGGDAE